MFFFCARSVSFSFSFLLFVRVDDGRYDAPVARRHVRVGGDVVAIGRRHTTGRYIATVRVVRVVSRRTRKGVFARKRRTTVLRRARARELEE